MAVAQISFYFCSRGKNTHAIILPFTDPCPYNFFAESNNSCSVSSRQNLIVRCLRSKKDHHGNFLKQFNEKNLSFEEEGENGVSRIFSSINVNVKYWIPRKLPKKLRSMIMLNLIAVVYASNIPVVKEVQESMDPAAFAAVRFTIAAIPFLPFVIQARDDVETRKAGLELGFWMSLGCLIEAVGLLTCEAGRASFISLFTVLVVPALESMLGEIVPARTWFGMLMSILGISMLECTGSPPNIGDLLNFLSAIFFGIHTLRTEQLSRSTRKENLLALLGYEVCVLAVLSIIWYLVGGNMDGPQQEGAGESWTWPLVWDWIVTFPWIPALYTGVFSTGIGLWAEIDAMRNVSATETAVIYGMEPLWGAGFAWFLLGERWGAAGWIGAALMLGGSLMVQIFGALNSGSKEDTANQNNNNGNRLSLGVDRQKMPNTIAASPIVISSKDIMKRL
ncbi:hypothetical protein LIER_05637 [Lithospermum erythrorhizon]|uniref:EamA domain-containing protein n=1 Tax=Lithospermum erythrorhizon TaxID=34254 RepID=A0AAV3P5C2_LITER